MRTISAAILLLIPVAAMAAGSSARHKVSALVAGSSVSHNKGGWFINFDPIVYSYNKSGQLFRIMGRCQSACTLFLAIKNVCIEPGATLAFHGAHDQTKHINMLANAHLLEAYNPKLREYVIDHHFLNSFTYHVISGSDMIHKFGYPQCGVKRQR